VLLLAKQREGKKKVRYVYDPAKTPLQRLLQSGALTAEIQQELTEVMQALDPMRLLHQLEQLKQAVFRCAVGCVPVISPIPSTSICIFCIQDCSAGALPAEGRSPDLEPGIQTLYQEQERRKRVLGWQHTHKDPFAGEWEQIFSWLQANPEREPRRHFPGARATLPWTLSAVANPHFAARHVQDPSLPVGNRGGRMARGSDPGTITLASFREILHRNILTPAN
jgi:hypothetical protein